MKSCLVVALAVVGACFLVPSAGATLPGYNGLIVFSSRDAPSPPEIWTMGPDGTDQTDLTPGINAIEPAWSPDGTKVAYVRDEGTSHEIWVMNADGSDQQQLTSGYYDNSPAWSPDGSKIVFSSTEPYDATAYPAHIWVMNSNGSNPQQLTTSSTTPNGQGLDPTWSPDGSLIAFDDGPEIYEMGSDGSNVTALAAGSAPNFSPTGNQVAFVSDQSSEFDQIWVMYANGTGQTELTDAPLGASEPVWSPDGTKIAFEWSGSNNKIATMNADGSDETELTQDYPYEADGPSWQVMSTPPNSTTILLRCGPPVVVAVGNSTPCTATVTNAGGGAAPGTLSFASSGAGAFSNFGNCTLSAGSCQFTYSPSSVGSGKHALTASYAGDWDHFPSSTTVSITVTPQLATLTVSLAGNGTGTVSSSPAGIECGSTCSQSYASGTSVTLSAIADPGSRFAGWSGACAGTGNCTPPINTATAVTAIFNKIATAPKACVVPKVTGESAKAAEREIKARSCEVGKLAHAYSTKAKKGTVISQSPKAHKRLKHNARISLVVSRGRR